MDTSSTRTVALFATLLALAPNPEPGVRAELGTEATALANEAKALFESGDGAKALEKVERALEWSKDEVELLDLASRAAEAANDKDQALWYGSLALGQATAPDQAPLAEALKARLTALDPLKREGEEVLASYAATLLELGRDCAKRTLWVNAVDLLNRCRGTPSEAAANGALAKIYEDKKAVEALLDSGVDVPLRARRQRASVRDAAAADLKHATWKSAWEIKADCYTVVTDLPRALAEQISLSMEQLNRFYRKHFHVKERGGDTARVTVKVYRTRAEFDEHQKHDDGSPWLKTIAGFYSPTELMVATYDPRDEDRPLSELWSTLFHEASHQFTHLISTGVIPSWLNEGTASYFEGARLLPNGAAETNLVPPGRLWYLQRSLEEGKPKLKEVVSYYEDRSYDGSYYPFGWGLVYFLLNYEDDRSQHPYEPLYRDYIASYRTGAKHDVVGRFVDYFVTKAKDPAIKSFDDFEQRWKAWILDLHDLYFGGSEKADVLLARARKQRANKSFEAAAASLRFALRKRPGDVEFHLELGETLAALKQNDAALFHCDTATRAARGLADPDQPYGASGKSGAALAADAWARIAKLNKELAEKLTHVEKIFVASASVVADAYAEEELPRTALDFLDRAELAFGESRELSQRHETLRSFSSDLDLRRWERVPIDEQLSAWSGSKSFRGGGDAIRAQTSGSAFLYLKEPPQLPYRFEVQVDSEDSKELRVAGLLFGLNDNSEKIQALLVYSTGGVWAREYDGGWKSDSDQKLGSVRPEQFRSFKLAIDVSRTAVEAWVDDHLIGRRDYALDRLRGGTGLCISGDGVVFRELRIRD